jgi:hypothetical protein
MKTTLLTIAGLIALSSIGFAQNPKFGYTRPEIRPLKRAAWCPMSEKVQVTHPAAFAKGGAAVTTTTIIKHDPSCPMLQGRRCAAMES